MRILVSSLMVVSAVVAAPAQADEGDTGVQGEMHLYQSSSSTTLGDELPANVRGGVLLGNSQGSVEAAAVGQVGLILVPRVDDGPICTRTDTHQEDVVNGVSTVKDRHDRKCVGAGHYGHMNLRLEAGTGVGMAGDLTLGKEVFKLDRAWGAHLHAGLEPINLRFNFNNNNEREDYFEWLPMASGGLQLAADACRVLIAARGGAALGTLGDNGAHLAVGGSTTLDCPGFELVGDVVRVDPLGSPTDLGTVDLAVGTSFKVGLRGEALVHRDEKAGWESLVTLPEATQRKDQEFRGLVSATVPF